MRSQPTRASLLLGLSLLLAACQPAAPSQSAAPKQAPAPAAAPAAPAAAPAASPAAAAPAASPAAAAPAAASPCSKSGPTRVTVGVTDTIESQNPYAGQRARCGYSVWCEVLRLPGGLDRGRTPSTRPGLAESWGRRPPGSSACSGTPGWHDGSPFTAADVVHSIDRIKTDRRQASRSQHGARRRRRERWTRLHGPRSRRRSRPPRCSSYFADLLIITSKAQYDQFGPDAIKTSSRSSDGPLHVQGVPGSSNQRLVITKNPGNWWAARSRARRGGLYRIMREDRGAGHRAAQRRDPDRPVHPAAHGRPHHRPPNTKVVLHGLRRSSCSWRCSPR